MSQSVDSPSPRTTLRPRFSLKLIFFALTTAAIAAGYWTAKWRAAEEMARIHNAVIDQLIDNLTTPPHGTTYPLPPRSKADLERSFGGRFGSGIPTMGIAAQVLGRGSMSSSAMAGQSLDVSGMARAGRAKDLAETILKHYVAGLSQLGFRATLSSSTQAGSKVEVSQLWSAASNDLVVLIDLKVDETNAAPVVPAEVRIIFIESQTLDVW
jgi:hypothetical protein